MRALTLSVLLAGCAAPHIVPLMAGAEATVPPAAAVAPLEVTVRATGIADPLPVRGTSTAFSNIEAALRHAIFIEAAPWGGTPSSARPRSGAGREEAGRRLLVEIAEAQATHPQGQTRLTMLVRATLRAGRDQRFIAQTQAHCVEAGGQPAEDAAPVFTACMKQIGGDLAGWLGRVDP